ncbi:MAG TPA: nitrilase-related carbon-nitrogen hydrolase [Spirochaetota bacterium]|nr:nitrilase-related carbon-nitrogen hydrolase [Spirochaetota bacterium]
MKIYLCQLEIKENRPGENRSAVAELMAASSPAAGSLVILPEMFSTGFTADPRLTDNRLYKEDAVFLSGLSQQYRVNILGSSISCTPSLTKKYKNLSLLFSVDGKPVTEYTKIYPFSYGGEHKKFTAGQKPVTAEISGLTVFPTLCYDLRFPELYRAGAALGAELFTVQANWPAGREEHWLTLLQARAIENQCWVAGVNCIGTVSKTECRGRSVLVSPYGRITNDGRDQAGMFSSDIKKEIAVKWRQKFPALKDRKKADFYSRAYGK